MEGLIHIRPSEFATRAVRIVEGIEKKPYGKLLTVNQAAEYSGLSAWTIRNMVHRGQLRYIPGKHWKIDVRDLDKTLESMKETREEE